MSEIPKDKPLLVHCKSGARAAAASALLEKEGFVVQYINDAVDPWLSGKEIKN
jgi:hydroxyacylglutathione hydrolase